MLDSDSEDEDGQESRKREGKTCSKGPQVGPSRATALWPYSMWSPAADSKSPVTRFIWRFDHSQIIVTESEAGGSYTASEEWRPYVKCFRDRKPHTTELIYR